MHPVWRQQLDEHERFCRRAIRRSRRMIRLQIAVSAVALVFNMLGALDGSRWCLAALVVLVVVFAAVLRSHLSLVQHMDESLLAISRRRMSTE